jgi:hypothetical protein
MSYVGDNFEFLSKKYIRQSSTIEKVILLNQLKVLHVVVTNSLTYRT